MGTRRAFLRSSGLALVSFGLAPRVLVRAAAAGDGTGRGRRKTLVVVLQRGACDGLNTVVPWGDPRYGSLRPTIAVPRPDGGRAAALDLDGFFGLHPALEPLLPFWKDRRLAVVHAVGSPDPTRSHFDAQDFLESGTPGRKATEDGWLNRGLRARPEGDASPLRAVALTPTLPRILAGRAPAVSMASLRDFALRGGQAPRARQGFEQMYAGAVSEALRGAGQETFEALEALEAVDAGGARASRAGRPGDRGAASLGQSLGQVAQLVRSEVGLEFAYVETGGWDHHANEGGVQGQLAGRLRDLAQGLSSFATALGPRLDDVLLVTLTEFGRTARENGNRGTDHGHGSVALVLGGAVRGGRVHGRWPGLEPGALYEGRDLAVTTDFRDLVGELLARHSGVTDLRSVFPGHDPQPGRFPGVLGS